MVVLRYYVLFCTIVVMNNHVFVIACVLLNCLTHSFYKSVSYLSIICELSQINKRMIAFS